MKSVKDRPPLHQTKIENPFVINEFGYVSQESAGFYEKFMNKYCNVKPEGYYLGPPSTNEMKVLKDKVKNKTKHAGNKRKRVKSKATISDDEEDDPGSQKPNPGDKNTYKVVMCSGDGDGKPQVPRIKILLPVRRPQLENDTQNLGNPQRPVSSKTEDDTTFCKDPKIEFAHQPKRRYVPAPLSFEELLKLAEKKQHEPILIRDAEFDFKRPMTRKEKARYQEKMERIKLKKEKLAKDKSVGPPPE